ncbi:hypothetical protein J4438_02880 [Candidatus Woesearchaeota archaeon]|nr:hypothetical protein [Candidatus Woesearchaeota archaeon]
MYSTITTLKESFGYTDKEIGILFTAAVFSSDRRPLKHLNLSTTNSSRRENLKRVQTQVRNYFTELKVELKFPQLSKTIKESGEELDHDSAIDYIKRNSVSSAMELIDSTQDVSGQNNIDGVLKRLTESVSFDDIGRKVQQGSEIYHRKNPNPNYPIPYKLFMEHENILAHLIR